MFASFAGLAGFAAQWKIKSEDSFVRRTLSGDTGAIADMIELIGATVPVPDKGADETRIKGVVYTPRGKVAMLRYLDAELTRTARVIKGHNAGAWALFCAAASAALKGDRTLCDTYDADCTASHAALKAAADKARADKAAAVKAAAPAAPAADPVAAALDVVNAAVNAGTLTDEQCAMLRAMVERLAVPV